MAPTSRRRMLRIVAAATAIGFIPARPHRPAAALEWTGPAFGTQARLVLHHDDPAAARTVVAACVAEIDRLENQFSLFRPHSALSVLNRDGHLDRPSLDMRRLLARAVDFGGLTGGVFDVTVQPVWQLLADTDGRPNAAALRDACARVDYRAIDIGTTRVVLGRPGMAVTLNGVAQGYATDRIAALLRDHGFGHVLVDIGELRALDGRADGAPWRVRLAHTGRDGPLIGLTDQAVATSSGGSSPFTPDGRVNHLIDPRTGSSPSPARTVSVVARDATTADALSTALSLMPDDAARILMHRTGAERAIITSAGRILTL